MSKFIGYRHFHGKSKKTGNEYDFFQCHFLKKLDSSRGDADGYEALTFSVTPDLFYNTDLAGNMNQDCEIFFNQFGRVEAIHIKK